MFILYQFFLPQSLTAAQFRQPFPSQHEHKPNENTLIKQPVPLHHKVAITMIASRKNVLTSLLFLLLSASVNAQTVLDQYIADAFNNNLVLKEKKIGLDKSLLAIKEARSLFLPTTWFETQYTLAQGGRTINIPIGDLLNPVY
ncbi:MAG: hypothetical protein ACK5BO_02230, partial [Bacteroidota bacterium]